VNEFATGGRVRITLECTPTPQHDPCRVRHPGRRRPGPSESAPRRAGARRSGEGGVARGGDRAPYRAPVESKTTTCRSPIPKETPDAFDPPIDRALACDNLENVVRRHRIDAGANRRSRRSGHGELRQNLLS
jgi:hypothetical protein